MLKTSQITIKTQQLKTTAQTHKNGLRNILKKKPRSKQEAHTFNYNTDETSESKMCIYKVQCVMHTFDKM